jgi:formylglycine-generating enzyme required for sulfatase activity
VEFCEKLTEQERMAGNLPTGYRYTLPTKEQWEKAYQEGKITEEQVNPNTKKQENPNGNFFEWSEDWVDSHSNGSEATSTDATDNDKTKPEPVPQRVLLGGNWDCNHHTSHSSRKPGYSRADIGFRVALAPE